jgi:hypothetical protein
MRHLEDQIQSGGSKSDPDGLPFFQAQLDELIEKLNLLYHSTSSDGAMVLANHTFALYHDLQKFVKEEQIISVGGFLDLFSALVVMTPKQQSGKEWANKQSTL